MSEPTKTSAQTAKDRLLNPKAIDLPTKLAGSLPAKPEDTLVITPNKTGVPGQYSVDFKEPAGPVKEPEVSSSVEATLAQRGSRYGDFTDHARLCQHFKNIAMGFTTQGGLRRHWDELPDVHKQALDVIFDKIARILSGDPNYDDNWHDIQGYAKLVEDRLPCNVKKDS